MRGAVLYGPRDVRIDERPDPGISEPTDAVIRLSATSSAGQISRPYVVSTQRASRPLWATSAAASLKTSAAPSRRSSQDNSSSARLQPDNTCPHCRAGYQYVVRASAWAWWQAPFAVEAAALSDAESDEKCPSRCADISAGRVVRGRCGKREAGSTVSWWAMALSVC